MTASGPLKREKTYKALIFSFVAFAFIGSAKILFNIIVGRSFGDESVEILGMVNIALSLAVIIVTICSTGYQTAINKFVSELLARHEWIKARLVFERVLRNALLIALPISVLVLALSGPLADLLQIEAIYLIVAVPIIVTETVYYLIRASFYSLNASRYYLVREIVADAAFLVVLVALVLLNQPALLLLSYTTMYLLFVIISIGEINRRLPPVKDKNEAIEGVNAFAGINAVASITSLATVYIASLFTGAVLGADDAGLFAAAFSITTMITIIPNVLSMVLTPEIAHLWGIQNLEGIKERIIFWTDALILLCGAIIGAMVILRQDIMDLLFGSAFAPAAVAFAIMSVGVMLQTIARPSTTVLVCTGYNSVTAVLGIASLIVALVVWVATLQTIGITGTALGFLAAATINCIGPIAFTFHKWKVHAGRIALPAMSFVLILAAVLLLVPDGEFQYRIAATVAFLAAFCAVNWKAIVRSTKDIRKY